MEEVAAPSAPAPGEPMDVNQALQLVLKKALAHDGTFFLLPHTIKENAMKDCGSGKHLRATLASYWGKKG